MNGCKAIVGLCILCALLVSAFAAQGASAGTNGTTAFTCRETGPGGGFTKAHCKSADAGSGNFSHVAITQDETTEVKISTENTNAETNACTSQTLKAPIAGLPTELSTCEVHSDGWMENRIDLSGEHYTVGLFTLTYTNVQIKTPPTVTGCKLFTDNEDGTKGEEGVVHTRLLRATTTGQGDAVKVEPTTGEVLATFTIEGCSNSGFNKTYEVTGSLICKPDGATLNCNHTEITGQTTLRVKSNIGNFKAGYDGATTAKGRANVTESYVPLSTTTVETE